MRWRVGYIEFPQTLRAHPAMRCIPLSTWFRRSLRPQLGTTYTHTHSSAPIQAAVGPYLPLLDWALDPSLLPVTAGPPQSSQISS